jgi:hypothetical protein
MEHGLSGGEGKWWLRWSRWCVVGGSGLEISEELLPVPHEVATRE